MKKILMVCLGNICRSPLAHGILASKLPSDQFYVDSAGTANYHIGDPPDQRSIAVAKKHGLDISQQRGQQFRSSFFDEFDIIYAMDESNYDNIIKLARDKDDISKVRLILDEDESVKVKNVPDPYYGDRSGFEYVYNLLDQVCETVSQKLQKN
ncbi:low molecular weight protein-tyrosine-phosphatase [Geojedonia litorea]|uniref:protein-tyrosine-phosphatase n=1 Tax=Geojedonia litorea TaxID=1268269 RepID=A0ABV9N585_9FLAO